MKKPRIITRPLQLLAFIVGSSATTFAQVDVNGIVNNFKRGLEEAKEAREAREAQRQALYQQQMEQEAAREDRREAARQESARIAAEQRAEAERNAAEQAARDLANKRSALDQNLGGLSLQVGQPSSFATPASLPPEPKPAPRPAQQSADPMLASRLRQVGEQVRAGRFAEARKLVEACATLYPDDPRPATVLEQINTLDPVSSPSGK